MYKKILLAIDNSDYAMHAIKKVIEFRKSWDCEVVMFHSIKHVSSVYFVPYSLATTGGSYFSVEKEMHIQYEIEGMELISDAKKIFDELDIPVETRLIDNERPEDYIDRIVEDEDFDLVVIGLKGEHKKPKSKHIGSVAKKVVKHSSCDVLVVK